MNWQGLCEKISTIPVRAKEAAGKLDNKKKKWIIIAGAAILIAAIAGTVLLRHNPSEVLFTGLNQQEVSEVVAKVQDMGASASFDKNGNVSVPASQADSLRAQLAMDGYPRSGLSYDVFSSNVGIMSTEFDRQAYKLYDLQDRIAGTLRWFDGVQDAVVTIDRGDENKYAIGSPAKEPTASVTLTMRGGSDLTDQQVDAIRHLVVKSVSGLKDENVAIADTSGRDYMTKSSDGTDSLALLKLELENQLDSTIQNKIFNLLSPVCGSDNLRVSVRSQIDVTKKVQEGVNYTPVTGSGLGVPSSQTKDTEISGAGQAAAGQPGTDTNAQVPVYPQVEFNGNDLYYKDGSSAEYLVDQIKEQVFSNGGELKDLTVTVMMDVRDMAREDLAGIREAVGNAAGISPELRDQKVVVLNQAFAEETTSVFGGVLLGAVRERNPLMLIGGAALLALLLALIVTISMRSKAKRRAMEDEQALALEQIKTQIVDQEEVVDLNAQLEEIKRTRETELKEQIRDFAQQNPEISAQLIKTWLKGGEGNA